MSGGIERGRGGIIRKSVRNQKGRIKGGSVGFSEYSSLARFSRTPGFMPGTVILLDGGAMATWGKAEGAD